MSSKEAKSNDEHPIKQVEAFKGNVLGESQIGGVSVGVRIAGTCRERHF